MSVSPTGLGASARRRTLVGGPSPGRWGRSRSYPKAYSERARQDRFLALGRACQGPATRIEVSMRIMGSDLPLANPFATPGVLSRWAQDDLEIDTHSSLGSENIRSNVAMAATGATGRGPRQYLPTLAARDRP